MIILPPVVCDVHFQPKGYHHFKMLQWTLIDCGIDPVLLNFLYRKAIHLPMSISGSYASNSMLHITSYRWPKRNLNKSDVSAPTKAWNTRRWLSAWMKLRWKSRRVNFYDASYTTPSWYAPFNVIKPSEHNEKLPSLVKFLLFAAVHYSDLQDWNLCASIRKHIWRSHDQFPEGLELI